MKYFIRKKRRLLFLLAAVVLSFVLITLHLSGNEDLSRMGPADKVLFWAVSPFQRSLSTIESILEIVWYDYIYLVKLKEKNEVLQEKTSRLESEVALLREKAVATERLARLLSYKASNPYEVVTARIIGFDSSGYFRTVVIDKGSDDGVASDMAVVVAAGAVGRIVKVHDAFSQVLLLVDYNSAIDSLVQRTRDKGIVVGQGSHLCEMKYVDRQADVKTGDIIVSSGLSGIFPPGLVIGEVIRVASETSGLFQEVVVKPAVRLEKLEEVLVITGEGS